MARFFLALLAVVCTCFASENETLNLTVVTYDALLSEDVGTTNQIREALCENGIVGVRGIPSFEKKVSSYIQAAQQFNALPERVKERCAPKQLGGVTDMYLGYMAGREKFRLPDGRWIVDDLKVSYYALYPDCYENQWPKELDLKSRYLSVAETMVNVGEALMKKIELIGPKTGITSEGALRVGRMLYYKSSTESSENPYWCGSHFDHSMFTALIPAFYFKDGKPIPEPEEAGLFVKGKDRVYRKVVANDPGVLLFQVGEFGQLAMDDQIQATEHRVHKANDSVERYTAALFFDAPYETIIRSSSKLTSDARYGGNAGDPCTYEQWEEASYKRYLVEDDSSSGS